MQPLLFFNLFKFSEMRYSKLLLALQILAIIIIVASLNYRDNISLGVYRTLQGYVLIIMIVTILSFLLRNTKK